MLLSRYFPFLIFSLLLGNASCKNISNSEKQESGKSLQISDDLNQHESYLKMDLSPDGKFIAVEDSKNGLELLELETNAKHDIKAADVIDFKWNSNSELLILNRKRRNKIELLNHGPGTGSSSKVNLNLRSASFIKSVNPGKTKILGRSKSSSLLYDWNEGSLQQVLSTKIHLTDVFHSCNGNIIGGIAEEEKTILMKKASNGEFESVKELQDDNEFQFLFCDRDNEHRFLGLQRQSGLLRIDIRDGQATEVLFEGAIKDVGIHDSNDLVYILHQNNKSEYILLDEAFSEVYNSIKAKNVDINLRFIDWNSSKTIFLMRDSEKYFIYKRDGDQIMSFRVI